MQGVRHSAHFFYISESGREGVLDAMYFHELPTEKQDQLGFDSGLKIVESLMDEPCRAMTDEEILAYLNKKTKAEFGPEDEVSAEGELQ